MSVSRRAFVSTAAASAVMPVGSILARQQATPAAGEGQRTLFHAARFTAVLPPGMIRIYPTQENYEDETGRFIATRPVPDITLDDLESAMKMDSEVEDFDLGGVRARHIKEALGLVSRKKGSVLLIEYPEPIPFLSSQASVLLVECSLEIAESFLPTISMDMSSVTPQEYLKEVLAFSESIALVSDAVDWPELKQTAESDVATIDDAHAFLEEEFVSTLDEAGDHHTRVYAPGFLAETEATPGATPIPDSMPEAEVLDDGVLLLTLPLIVSGDTEEYVAICNDALAEHANSGECSGVIVDLRTNHGGSIYTMIAALAPLIPSGEIYGYKYPKIDSPEFWSKNSVIRMLNQLSGVSANDFDYTQAPVAVLMGPDTASSAELTAISFIGRPNTTSFGMDSGGYTTANNSYALMDGWIVNLAASVMTDSAGNEFGGPLTPDSEIAFTTEQIGTPDDPVLAAARDWLQQACASGNGTPAATPVE